MHVWGCGFIFPPDVPQRGGSQLCHPFPGAMDNVVGDVWLKTSLQTSGRDRTRVGRALLASAARGRVENDRRILLDLHMHFVPSAHFLGAELWAWVSMGTGGHLCSGLGTRSQQQGDSTTAPCQQGQPPAVHVGRGLCFPTEVCSQEELFWQN